MKRLIEKTVLVGFVTAWRLATVPTRRSPPCVKATTEGVVRPPSEFSITVGSPPSRTAMHELVVPRSMPMVLAIRRCSFKDLSRVDADHSRSGTCATGHSCRSRGRSEEHTSELQSQSNLVCRLLLEKKKDLQTNLPDARHPA